MALRLSRRKSKTLRDGLFVVCLMIFFIVLVILGFLLMFHRRNGVTPFAGRAAASNNEEQAPTDPFDNFIETIEAQRRAHREKMAVARSQLSYLTAQDVQAGNPDDFSLTDSSNGGGGGGGGIQVVLWDNPYGTPFYWGQGREINEPNYGGYRIEKERCPVRCEWHLDKRYVATADVVMVDPCAIGTKEWRRVPPHMPEKRAGQKWLYFGYEQARYFELLGEARYLELFDGQMTYEREASLQHITMMCPWGGLDTWLAPAPAKTEEKLVAFMASNCGGGGAETRTRYVEELMRHIDVHSFGLCLHNRDNPHDGEKSGGGWHDTGLGGMMKAKIKLFSEYQFVLAFENTFAVDDYVTEKLATAFLAGAVPVYLGAANVDDWLPGPHSIIRADHFASPRDLATFLLEVAADRTRYAAYFAWKKHGLADSFRVLLDNCVFNAECNLCKTVHRAQQQQQQQQKKGSSWHSMTTTMMNANPNRPGPSLATSGGGSIPAQHHTGTFRDASALQLNRQDLSFRTDDQYVQLLEVPSQPLQLRSDFTVAAWIHAGGWSGTKNFIVDNSASGGTGFSLAVLEAASSTHGVIEFCTGTTLCVRSSLRVPVGRWVHVAVTCGRGDGNKNGGEDGVHVTFFVDGMPEERKLADPLYVRDNSVRMRFGKPTVVHKSWRARHPDGIFDGAIDDVVLIKRAVSPLALQSFMFSRLDILTAAGLVGYWDFNEGAGDIVHDSSQLQHHARIFGQPQWIPVVARPLTPLKADQ